MVRDALSRGRTATSTSTRTSPNSMPGNGSPPADLLRLIVPFKRALYEAVLREFAALL